MPFPPGSFVAVCVALGAAVCGPRSQHEGGLNLVPVAPSGLWLREATRKALGRQRVWQWGQSADSQSRGARATSERRDGGPCLRPLRAAARPRGRISCVFVRLGPAWSLLSG